ncbi:hypothetical protein [Pedobacter steynii]
MSTLEINLDAPVDIAGADKQEQEVIKETPKGGKWKNYQKIAFRIGFLYMLFLCIPTYPKFYEELFSLRFSKITYHDFQAIVAFWPPQIVTIESEEGVFGLLNYINLILLLGGSVVGGLIWTALDKKSTEYSKLYYWIRYLPVIAWHMEWSGGD